MRTSWPIFNFDAFEKFANFMSNKLTRGLDAIIDKINAWIAKLTALLSYIFEVC